MPQAQAHVKRASTFGNVTGLKGKFLPEKPAIAVLAHMRPAWCLCLSFCRFWCMI